MARGLAMARRDKGRSSNPKPKVYAADTLDPARSLGPATRAGSGEAARAAEVVKTAGAGEIHGLYTNSPRHGYSPGRNHQQRIGG